MITNKVDIEQVFRDFIKDVGEAINRAEERLDAIKPKEEDKIDIEEIKYNDELTELIDNIFSNMKDDLDEEDKCVCGDIDPVFLIHLQNLSMRHEDGNDFLNYCLNGVTIRLIETIVDFEKDTIKYYRIESVDTLELLTYVRDDDEVEILTILNNKVIGCEDFVFTVSKLPFIVEKGKIVQLMKNIPTIIREVKLIEEECKISDVFELKDE